MMSEAKIVESYVDVLMVCDCGNLVPHMPGICTPGKHYEPCLVIHFDANLEHICGKCGGIMQRKIVKHEFTETETEIIKGEN